MNTVWSTFVQGIETLYETRSLRFADIFKEKYQRVFQIEGKKEILEIGCGPGALCEALIRWYPGVQIYGIDKDSNFIEFAKKRNSDIYYSEDDAENLSFEDEKFDVTISNTVAEHIEPSKFYKEQYRVLKQQGICLVMSVRKSINLAAPCIAKQSDFEKNIWERVQPCLKQVEEKYHVCDYPQSEIELPRCMETYGFKNVSTDYLTINLTPDNPFYTKQMAHLMINANRMGELEGADRLLSVASDKVTDSEVQELKNRINEKYDQRIALYNRGIKQWDTNMTILMIIRGVKTT